MVGTNPIRSPAFRQRATSLRRSSTFRTWSMALAVDLAQRRFFGTSVGPGGAVALPRSGEAPFPDARGEFGDRLPRSDPQLGVSAHEARRDPLFQAEQVVVDQHLPVAVRAGADADGRNFQTLADLGSQVGGDALQDQGEGAGLFKLQ